MSCNTHIDTYTETCTDIYMEIMFGRQLKFLMSTATLYER